MSLLQTFQHIRVAMLEHNDAFHASKVEQLIEKIHKQKAVISMCGHFSAGKSSLINALCGAKLLPSGPIPTSANPINRSQSLF